MNTNAAPSEIQTHSEVIGSTKIALRFDHAPCERDVTAASPLYLEILGRKKQSFTLTPDGAPAACQGLADLVQQDDFNFDGYPDFAIKLDFMGGNGSNSYRVFVFQPKTGTFVQAPELTLLTQTFMGLFEVDRERKRLIATSRSSCCRIYGEYSVLGIKAVAELTEVATYTYEGDDCSVEIERTVKGQPRAVTRRPCDEHGD